MWVGLVGENGDRVPGIEWKVDCQGGLQIELKRRNVFENRQQT